jgi:hypothetical protein
MLGRFKSFPSLFLFHRFDRPITQLFLVLKHLFHNDQSLNVLIGTYIVRCPRQERIQTSHKELLSLSKNVSLPILREIE